MEALFLFNRRIGSDEETATVAERTEKLLFYDSSCGDDLEEQLERLSLCETFIDLCRSFQADAPCESVFMDDHQYTLLECEPDTWLAVCCKSRLANFQGTADTEALTMQSSYTAYSYSAPTQQKKSPIQKLTFRRREGSGQKSAKSNASKFDPDNKLYKTGSRSAEDHENIRIFESSDPNAKVLKAILQRLYNTFTLFHGRIEDLLGIQHSETASGGKDSPAEIKRLRKALRKCRNLQELIDEGDLVPDEQQRQLLDQRMVYEDQLADLLAVSPADQVRQKLATFVPLFLPTVDFSRLHLLYDFDALPHLPVDKTTFLDTQQAMLSLSRSFSVIEGVALLYNDCMLWSSIPMDLLSSIHLYLQMYSLDKGHAGANHENAGVVGTVNGAGSDSHSSPKDKDSQRVPVPPPGFLEIGQSLYVQEHGKPVDGADIYFPRIQHIEGGNKGYRMAVYRRDKALVVILARDVDAPVIQREDTYLRDDTDRRTDDEEETRMPEGWSKARLLEFCAELERYLTPELELLCDTIFKGLMSNKEMDMSQHQHQPHRSSFSEHQSSNHHQTHRNSQTNLLGTATNDAVLHNLLVADATERFIYHNESGSIVKISDAWLNQVVEKGDSYPGDSQMGIVMSVKLIQVLNEIRRQFDSCSAESMTLIEFVRPNASRHEPACWVAAIKSLSRQVYLTLDGKHSFEFVAQRLRNLQETAFRSIFLL